MNKYTPEYKAFYNARLRCNNPKSKAYNNYGGRGIMFLFNSFEEFYKEIGPKPLSYYQLDRIDNNGHYEKGNVRWTTPKENRNNSRKKIKKEKIIGVLDNYIIMSKRNIRSKCSKNT